MKIKNLLKLFTIVIVLLVACSPDDPEINVIPDRDRTEQQVTDNALLQEYLNSHYYNSNELSLITNASVDDIVISELTEGAQVPPLHTLLATAVELKSILFENTNYDYYILKINQGGGANRPAFTDKVRVTYEGSLTDDGSVFDNSPIPVSLDLVGLNEFQGTIPGWRYAFTHFNDASSFNINQNGDIIYDDFGLGVMFLPSGLSYFSRAQDGIPAYSNLIFKFSLLQTEQNDHDSDGIPSAIEDFNNNSNPFDDDTDGDSSPNYTDTDDDGDGVATINELIPSTETVDTNLGEQEPILNANQFERSRSEVGGIITINIVTIADANNNTIPDYLEDSVTTNYNE
jgi:hypothetical protein